MDLRRVFAASLLLIFSAHAWPAGGSGAHLMEAKVDLDDTRSLQRGARLFVNYCLSCHSASFMRYNRMGRDLEIPEDQVRESLMFAAEKTGDRMTVAMKPEDGQRWFGTPPPDLSVIARSRGEDWLYTYLLTFYEDDNPSRVYGVNNLVFKDVGMPNVLWELQGTQVPVYKEIEGPEGEPVTVIDGLKISEPGTMTPVEFRRAMRDLVSFLVYMGEPAKLQRYNIGVWVLAFLVVLYLVSFALKKEYWKDVH